MRELWAYQLLITPVPNPEKEEEEAPIAPPTQVKSSLSQFVYTASQDDKKGSGSDTESDKDDKRSPNPEAEANADDEDGNDSDSTKSEHSAASHDTDAELMAQLSENSDGELLGGPDDYSSSGPPVPRKRPKLRVSDTLVCLVLGLWLLRIPFTHVDLEA